MTAIGRGAWALGRKILLALLTLWLVSVVIFAVIEILPQDPATAALGAEATDVQRAAFHERLHLDDPPLERYARWVGGMLSGDLGDSIVTGRPIADEVLPRMSWTALLALLALVLGTALALPLALLVARRPGRPADVTASFGASSITAVPEYVVGIVLLALLATNLQVLPVLSADVARGSWSGLVLPTLTLALGVAAYTFRLARASVADALAAPYVRAAVLNGLPPGRVLWRHVLPNVGGVVINASALNALHLLGGVVVVESLFAYPGLGEYLVEAVNTKDLTAIEGVTVLMSALFIGINLVADALVLVLDPRLRTT